MWYIASRFYSLVCSNFSNNALCFVGVILTIGV
ncbi:hypothetical protein KC19_3G031300 [Ceratodon purpureus]|uniref:Uncharacterized protein n=1 Tax=Ceratodon purpureus TaxID=3225 RepID=A0A8T0IE88_CERPU|nr:hypothetical protein KC19_3G031300 [Ceratodon purpureus]